MQCPGSASALGRLLAGVIGVLLIGGEDVAAQCPPGFTAGESSGGSSPSAPCTPCAVGEYSTDQGACAPCPAGTISHEASASASDCSDSLSLDFGFGVPSCPEG
eukprot:COSAG06_NODE_51582_length_311_cov_0.726415_1_plen_103_part_11